MTETYIIDSDNPVQASIQARRYFYDDMGYNPQSIRVEKHPEGYIVYITHDLVPKQQSYLTTILFLLLLLFTLYKVFL